MNGPKDYRTKQKTTHDITYLWNLKYDTNEHIYETKGESGSPALQVDSLPAELPGKPLIISRSIHVAANGIISFFFKVE